MARAQPVDININNCDQDRKNIKCVVVGTSLLFAGLICSQLYLNKIISTKLVELKIEVDKASYNQVQISWIVKSLKEGIRELEMKLGSLTTSVNGLTAQQMNTQLIDFAQQLAGARIISTSKTEPYGYSGKGYSLLGFPICQGSTNAEVILKPTSKPGDCWAVKGSEARATIQLSSLVHVQNFSVEHMHKSQAPLHDTSSAPNKFSFWGLESEKCDNKHFFGTFNYNNNGSAVQTFPVKIPGLKPYRIVEFQVHSNHGNPNYTCIYKIRVHGREASSVTVKYL